LRGGEILLLEDTAGKGHRTRNVEPRERRSIFIILDPEVSLP
jgi:methyl coenzyme M reductase subunit C